MAIPMMWTSRRFLATSMRQTMPMKFPISERH